MGWEGGQESEAVEWDENMKLTMKKEKKLNEKKTRNKQSSKVMKPCAQFENGTPRFFIHISNFRFFVVYIETSKQQKT